MNIEDSRVLIQEDYSTDTLKIYWRERVGNSREIWYNHDGELLISNEVESIGYRPVSIKPFLTMPLRIGKAFLVLLSDQITDMGINQRVVDENNGKLKLIESELNFNKDQLVKFINHFTK